MDRTETFSLHDPVIPRDTSQDELLANTLGRAFHHEPSFVYAVPEERVRRSVLPSFFLGAIRFARSYGQIDTTPMIGGAALWIRPGHELTFSQMAAASTLVMPFKLGWRSLKRCVKLGSNITNVHKRLVNEPHWYLMALGAEPSKQQSSIAGALLEPGLLRADTHGLPCYLETFQKADLSFYEAHGFRIVGAGCIPVGPSFWAMIRIPRR